MSPEVKYFVFNTEKRADNPVFYVVEALAERDSKDYSYTIVQDAFGSHCELLPEQVAIYSQTLRGRRDLKNCYYLIPEILYLHEAVCQPELLERKNWHIGSRRWGNEVKLKVKALASENFALQQEAKPAKTVSSNSGVRSLGSIINGLRKISSTFLSQTSDGVPLATNDIRNLVREAVASRLDH
jgi:hypothetical protein